MGYFHVVFTLPAELAPVALQNKRVVYDILFRAASETLLEIAADPRHLGARIGFLCVLHTWGQTLVHHPHLHCVVPGGGLSSDGRRWIAARKNFFLAVKVLSRVFRGKLLDCLGQAYRGGQLMFTESLEHLRDAERFDALVRDVRKKPWVVYSKAPMAGPERVLKYLARYTHRVAIANSRLVSFEEDRVAFRYKDYAQGGEQRILSLDAVEFLRCFLLHVLPRGFQRNRHYGLLANACRREKIARCRTVIDRATVGAKGDEGSGHGDSQVARLRCPEYGTGVMVTIEIFRPYAARLPGLLPAFDSS